MILVERRSSITLEAFISVAEKESKSVDRVCVWVGLALGCNPFAVSHARALSFDARRSTLRYGRVQVLVLARTPSDDPQTSTLDLDVDRGARRTDPTD